MSEQKLYRSYGSAGKSMQGKGFQKKFGKTNSRVGASGERILFNRLRDRNHGWLRPEIPLFCSLKVPGYDSDIDFVVAYGRKILLIDAKKYKQDGGIFWNFPGSNIIRHGWTKYRSKHGSGKPITMSKSMIMAKDIISRRFPGYEVEAIVVFVTDRNLRNSKEPMVRFLTFPGGVKSYNESSAQKFIKKFFRSEKQPSQVEKTLRKMVQ